MENNIACPLYIYYTSTFNYTYIIKIELFLFFVFWYYTSQTLFQTPLTLKNIHCKGFNALMFIRCWLTIKVVKCHGHTKHPRVVPVRWVHVNPVCVPSIQLTAGLAAVHIHRAINTGAAHCFRY